MGIESLHTAAAAAGFAMATSDELLVAELPPEAHEQVEMPNPWGARELAAPKSSVQLPALRTAAPAGTAWSQLVLRTLHGLVGRGATA